MCMTFELLQVKQPFARLLDVFVCLFGKQKGTKGYKLPLVKNFVIFRLTMNVAGISESSSTKKHI